MHRIALLTLALPILLASSARASVPCPAPHIRAHLQGVEAELLAADTAHLSPAQRENRRHHIAVLGDYRERCEFPKNVSHPDRLVTIFVDDDGVRCAVGHLMAEDGRGDLVDRIRATRNTATVWELANDAEVARWIYEAGLSLYEAARIQPAYCFMNRGGTCLCGGEYPQGEVLGVAEGAIVSVSVNTWQVEVMVDAVHGNGAVVGETRTAAYVEGDVVGRRALVVIRQPIDSPVLVERGAEPLGNGQVQCTSGYGPDPKYCANVTKDLYVEALLAEDCMARLVAVHPELETSVCDLGGAACGTVPEENAEGDGGCSGGIASAWWLVLIGLYRSMRPSSRKSPSRIVNG